MQRSEQKSFFGSLVLAADGDGVIGYHHVFLGLYIYHYMILTDYSSQDGNKNQEKFFP